MRRPGLLRSPSAPQGTDADAQLVSARVDEVAHGQGGCAPNASSTSSSRSLGVGRAVALFLSMLKLKLCSAALRAPALPQLSN
mmetsp:Transcript_26505/g.85656  ORF Transcript_26505/g.85656 Transcript_26505/m.85656 type:complete len:83 (-) Transcript_26505:281-529(-)